MEEDVVVKTKKNYVEYSKELEFEEDSEEEKEKSVVEPPVISLEKERIPQKISISSPKKTPTKRQSPAKGRTLVTKSSAKENEMVTSVTTEVVSKEPKAAKPKSKEEAKCKKNEQKNKK